jgi:hypothetical protein
MFFLALARPRRSAHDRTPCNRLRAPRRA